MGDSLGDTINGFLKPSNQHLSVSMLTKVKRSTILITPNRQTCLGVRPQLTSPFKCYSSCKSDRGRFDRFFMNQEKMMIFSPGQNLCDCRYLLPKLFLTTPPEPDEARIRSYFERNRLSFDPPAPAPSDGNQSEAEKGARGPVGAVDANESLDLVSSSPLSVDSNESNESSEILVTFEQVKEASPQSNYRRGSD